MRIRIKDISVGGLEVEQSMVATSINLPSDDFLKFEKPLFVKASIQKAGSTIIVNASVQVFANSFCARCLEPVEHGWSEEFSLDYQVDGNTEFLDIADDLRQEVILDLPIKILCKDDCQGLCVGCGVNLNQEQCKCKK